MTDKQTNNDKNKDNGSSSEKKPTMFEIAESDNGVRDVPDGTLKIPDV